MPARTRALVGSVVLLVVLTGVGAPSLAAARDAPRHAADGPVSAAPHDAPPWRWPVAGFRRVVAPYRAPAHAYGPGHRGVDIAASPGASIVAPADGVVAFRGTVADRPVLTIRHADGVVSTFEPLSSTLAPGDTVAAGDPVGLLAAGGHTPPGALHLGARRDGVYIDPMTLFGEVPRAVLLPCCGEP